jgi:predicted deacylase
LLFVRQLKSKHKFFILKKKDIFLPKIDVSQGITIDDTTVAPGQHALVRVNAGKLPTDNRINVFAHVYNSGVPGPVLLILAGVHGDEINGIEIVRRSLENRYYENITKGGVIIIPLLNVYGFINFSRDTTDGKDVNRSFPGHLNGSLASRVARIITLKFLPLVDLAIDFHTGGADRYNYPQVRFNHNDNRAAKIAEVFGAPVLMESALIASSFRKSAYDQGVPAVVFEGGESVRLDQHSIDTGLQGIKNVMGWLGIKDEEHGLSKQTHFLIEKSTWLRAHMAGMFLWYIPSGNVIKKGEILGVINDPYGTKTVEVVAKSDGIIIGHNNASVVNLGDPLFHIGSQYRVIQAHPQQTF